MQRKALRSVSAGSGRKKVPSDVSPSTSLPPLVEGQLRCFLRVTVSRVQWTVHKPPTAVFVRLRWWGESSDGTHFFPRDGLQVSQKTVKTTARFPIRCGPKQFTSYLTDMGSLVLDVLTKLDHLPIAKAQVTGISRVSVSEPISGFFTLVSPTSERLGELEVSLYLEPLTEAYDGSSSVPNPDLTVQGPQARLTLPSQPRSLSYVNKEDSAGNCSGNTLRGKYSQTAEKKRKEDSPENQMLTKQKPQNGQTIVTPSSEEHCQDQTTNNVLSVILERGNKLRNAMVVLPLKSDMDSAAALNDAPLPLPKDNILPPSRASPPPFGMLHQNVLHTDSNLKHSDGVAVLPDCFSQDGSADNKNVAVDLFLGRLNTSPLPLWDGEGSYLDSISGYSSVGGDSTLCDPQYDQSLLEHLFYRTPMSNIRQVDTEAEVQNTNSVNKWIGKNSSSDAAEKDWIPFGPGPKVFGGSNLEHHESLDDGLSPGLTVEHLKHLNLIQLAMVTIDSLSVSTGSLMTTARKTSNRGKPPQPLVRKKCSYFVEYMFPMASTPSHSQAADSRKVTRAVSSKVTDGVVKFNQRSVFPVKLSRAAIKKWLETDLIFNIYLRRSDQMKPVAVGKAVHPLRCLLQHKELSQCVVLPVLSVEGHGESRDIGPLKVLLELAADNKGLCSDKRGGRIACSAPLPSHTICSPPRLHSSRSQHVDTGREGLTADSFPSEEFRHGMWNTQKVSGGPSPQPGLHTSSHTSGQQAELDSQILLHALLMVPNGKNFDCGPMQTPNVYLNCKVFWNDEMARSVISWGHTNPSFNFIQVTPVTLTAKLLERMKNNVMVIEVWQKTRNVGNDRLLGLVKLPLHQFYVSFRDPKIVHLLLQAQYPVLGVDCFMPVMDVFSGTCKGNLRVVLAMGQSEQIIALQRTRDEEYDSLSHLVRPVHLLDHQPHSQTTVFAVQEEATREHLFVIRVEKIIGLMPLQSTVWGEADCYIQYAFPSQEGKPAKIDQNLIESSVNLKTFRTTTTLCVPEPVFGHSETHVLFAPEGVPVQRLFLSSLSSQGLSSGGGVHFEVWCRYYYPNVRDQLVAKGLLPLSKLCALVTMQREQHSEAQMFSLPLVPRMENATSHHPQPSGILDVSINYKHRAVRPDGQIGRGAASRVVTLVVQVHRAAGLQAAARKLSERDERFQYYAVAGVNTYVTVQFSFLPERERRCTRIVAKTFCPEFDHHMELSCDLLVQRNNRETCSLAQQLDEGFAIFTVWNRESPKCLALHTPKPKDMMLGFVKISLAELIHKTTGISGWFGVYLPREPSTSNDLVGGLEISVNFLHHSDRERVIQAARGLGWEIAHRDSDKQDDEEVWEDGIKTMCLTFSMPRAWIPLHCLLLPGHSELMRSTYCYFRYKFYDQDAFCSQMKHPSVEESEKESLATVAFQGSRTFLLRGTQPLMWYLREERLEVQVWVAFKKDKTQKPRDTDRLVGSAFVSLSSLAKMTKQSLNLSGVYPLFRRAASDLHGAALRVHINLTTDYVPAEASGEADNQVDTNSDGEVLPEEMEAADQVPAPPTFKQSYTQTRQQDQASKTTEDITSVQHAAMSMDESFPVTVVVDRAMHLSLKGCPLAERSGGMPCCCVSYVTASSAEPVSTSVINSDCPVWDHQQECRLSKQLLVDPQQSLVFKVWHKGEMDRVIGFASVDLSPLLCGFQSVCGWYNITGFSGQCHGQLKVSITPIESVYDIQGQRSAAEETIKTSSDLSPLTYRTTATYNRFPSHISPYLEQKISSSDHTNQLFTARSHESDRHDEHMDKVRLYHQSLQEQTAAHSECSSTAVGNNPSSSVLFSALRKNLSELDNIQKYFSHKLLTPTFPLLREQHSRTNQEQTLQGHHLKTMTFDTQRDSSPPPTGVGNIPVHISSPTTPSESSREDSSPLPSPVTKMCEDHVDSGAEEQRDNEQYIGTVSEGENNEDGGIIAYKKEEEVVDDDEDSEDFEEVVVNPRHLNEVTSLTDKTSPWTSVLSDTEPISETCLESSDDPDLSEDEETQQSFSQTINQPDEDWSENHKCIGLEESDQADSEGDTSDSRRHGIKALEHLHEDQGDEPTGSEQKSGEGPSPRPQNITDSSHFLHDEDTQLQHSDPMEVPNFFLPPHQLEASLRAICLAPSFSQPSSGTGLGSSVHNIPHRKVPRPQPVMSPSSMKKETARIAKIFTTHFNEDQ